MLKGKQKFIIIIIIIILLILILLFKNYFHKSLVNESKIIAESVISLYQGAVTYENEEINDEIRVLIKNHHNSLKELDNNEYIIDITPSDGEYETVLPEDYSYDDDNDSEVSLEDVNVSKEDTIGLKKIDDSKYSIKVNDIVFTKNGISNIIINGVINNVFIQDIEETYEMIKKNPNYIYTEYKIEDKGKTINVFYKSVITNKLKIIEVKNNGKNIVDFKIK